MAEGEVVHLSAENFDEEVLKSKLPVLVDFWAPWCMPCQIVGPVVEKLAGLYAGKVKFCKLNVEDVPAVAGKYSIMSIPTLVVFKGGNPVDQIIGAASEEQIGTTLDKTL